MTLISGFKLVGAEGGAGAVGVEVVPKVSDGVAGCTGVAVAVLSPWARIKLDASKKNNMLMYIANLFMNISLSKCNADSGFRIQDSHHVVERRFKHLQLSHAVATHAAVGMGN